MYVVQCTVHILKKQSTYRKTHATKEFRSQATGRGISWHSGTGCIVPEEDPTIALRRLRTCTVSRALLPLSLSSFGGLRQYTVFIGRNIAYFRIVARVLSTFDLVMKSGGKRTHEIANAGSKTKSLRALNTRYKSNG